MNTKCWTNERTDERTNERADHDEHNRTDLPQPSALRAFTRTKYRVPGSSPSTSKWTVEPSGVRRWALHRTPSTLYCTRYSSIHAPIERGAVHAKSSDDNVRDRHTIDDDFTASGTSTCMVCGVCDQPTSRPTNQPTNQPTDHSTNQPTNHNENLANRPPREGGTHRVARHELQFNARTNRQHVPREHHSAVCVNIPCHPP